MFKFIKGIFKKQIEKEQIIEEISLDSIQQWSANKKYKAEQDIENFLVSTKPEFEGIVAECKQSIITLRAANLLNQKIPENEKIMMEGNRDSFTKTTERLLAALIYPTASTLELFLENSDSAFKTYEKMSLRPFAILQHFFEHESRAINSCAHKLFLIVTKIKEFRDSSGFIDAIETEQKAKELILDSTVHKEHQKKLAELTTELEQKEKSISEKQEFLKSAEFISHTLLLQEKEKITKSINDLHAELESIFSALRVPLQKLARLHPDFTKRVAIFENFQDALPDKGTELIYVISTLKKELENDSLDLKDTKKESAIQKAGMITKEFLDSWNDKRMMLTANLDSINKEISASSTGAKQESAMAEIESLRASKMALEHEKSVISKKLATYNIAKILNDFEAKNNVRIRSE